MNPTGKGGFGDNPQNRTTNGKWSSADSISHWYNKLLRMDMELFEKFKPATMAQKIAQNAVIESQSELGHLKEVTDRTEGKPLAKTELSGANGAPLELSLTPVTFIKEDEPKPEV
jgi:hypothetical protein